MPAVVLSRALREAGHETMLVTEGRDVEQEMLDRCGCPSATLPVGRGGPGLPLRLVRAGVRARRLLRDQGIDLVVSCGGRTSLPAGLAAKSLGLPLCLMELNAVTGRSNRLLAPLADRIYLGLPQSGARVGGGSRRSRELLTGTPLREGLCSHTRETARRALSLDLDRPVVLVTGGSQGASFLNERVPDAICRTGLPLQVVHLSGPDRDVDVRARYDAAPQVDAMVRGIVMEMGTLYAACDLVISRGGGGTVAELMEVGRPAVIVPYPHHKDRQQWHNGRVLEAAGAALVCEEHGSSVESLVETLAELLASPDRLRDMGRRARRMAPENACRRILDDLRSLGALD